MSRKSNNGKFVHLDGVRVSYRAKDDVIQITSVDEDLNGEPFQITLKQGTASENSLRKILIEQGVIQKTAPSALIPKFIELPASPSPYGWSLIPLGVTENQASVYWNVFERPHALIGGKPASGKTICLSNIYAHCMNFPEDWEFVAIDRRNAPNYSLHTYTNAKVLSNIEDIVDDLQELEEIMEDRYERMELAGVPNFKQLPEDVDGAERAIMIAIDEAALLLRFQENPELRNEEYKDLTIKLRKIIFNIACLGRAAGLFLAISTQNSGSNTIFPELRNQLDVRIGFGELEPSPSLEILDNDDYSLTKNFSSGRGLGIGLSLGKTGSEPNIIQFQGYGKPQHSESSQSHRQPKRFGIF